jgi:sulfur carrier protein ThiS
MPITVYLPPALRPYAAGAEALTITQPVHTIAELVIALERRAPRLAAELEDSVFNFAVNDELLLHGVLQHRVRDGDRVEIVAAMSGTHRTSQRLDP